MIDSRMERDYETSVSWSLLKIIVTIQYENSREEDRLDGYKSDII